MSEFARRIRRIILGPTETEPPETAHVRAEPLTLRPAQPDPPADTQTTPWINLDGAGHHPDDLQHARRIIAAARADTTEPAPPPTQERVDTMTNPSPDAHPNGDTPAPNPVTDSGVHTLEDDYQPPTLTVRCPTCGSGTTTRAVNELLRESAALIPLDGGDVVIREFYTRLLHAAPDLAPLFPRDLLVAATQEGASPGAMQRDKLLNAVVGLADLWGSSRADMDHLDTLLQQWGRSHAAFTRPDGTVRGATKTEYDGVGQLLIGTLADVIGDRWRPEYEQAWATAYDDAALVMRWAQRQSGMTAARYPRKDAHHA